MRNIIILALAMVAMTMTAAKPKTIKARKATKPLTIKWRGEAKVDSLYGNPITDFQYNADPTAVEYNGRLYVYATNDQQQLEETRPDSANTYERINSLTMVSTDDMANWTYHGLIHTKQLAPWIIASWAPSVCSRVEADGKTHFYLYFSNSGFGTGVLTATSPVGPWISPLTKSIVDAETQGLGDCRVPFDPGVAIDDEGHGWLAFGAGKARVARLGADMLSFDSDFAPIPAPHHFEANELNFINGKMLYTYNNDWKSRDDWPLDTDKPSICSMAYMIPDNPLDSTSWHYQHQYNYNPGEDGYEYSNNHTHIHKYKGQWYMLYHTMVLKGYRGIKGGFRSIQIDEMDVDEENLDIKMWHASRRGPRQLKNFEPFIRQQAETVAGTIGVAFDETDSPGNMIARTDSTGLLMVRSADFTSQRARSFVVNAKGRGQVDVRIGNPDGQLVASMLVDSPEFADIEAKVTSVPAGVHNIFIIFSGKDLRLDSWQMRP